MLQRAAHRLETTWLLSRQALPRPARLYTTPSRVARAPAVASVAAAAAASATSTTTATAGNQYARPELPGYLVHQRPVPRAPTDEDRILNDLERFLLRDRAYTVLPPPPPTTSDSTSSLLNLNSNSNSGETAGAEETWVTDTTTQESMSIMDACLHNLYDVPRAKIIFNLLRQNATSSLLQTGVYNAFIEAYFGMATQKDVEGAERWLEDVHDLYEILESELENTAPNKMTYGLMLRVWEHFNRESSTSTTNNKRINLPSPSILLEKMTQRKISPTLVVAETVFDTHESATAAIKILSQAAVNLNIPEVIAELGQAEALAVSEDELKDVPEVMPVMRPAKFGEDGTLLTSAEVPFNIAQLRRHLTEVNQTRRVLPEDVMARQKHLEKSAYDVALGRLQQQAETLDALGVGNRSALNGSTLQKWMWEWHLALRRRIEEEIGGMKESEERIFREAGEGKRKMTTTTGGVTHPALIGVPSTTGARNKQEALSPYLTLVKSERLSLITILEIMRLQGSSGLADGMKTTRALVSVGKAVEMEYKAQMGKKSRGGVYVPKEREQDRDSAVVRGEEVGVDGVGDGKGRRDMYSQVGYRNMQERRQAVARDVEEGEGWSASWSQTTRSKIGGILVDCLMEVAEVERTAVCKKTGDILTEMQPAFHHAYEYLRGNKLGVIRLNPVVAERLAKDQLRDTLHPRQLPMLVKPQPWISHNIGGYLYSKTPVMRYKDSLEQQVYIKEASKNGQFELVYAGLDVLASTPWRINRKVFDVVIQVWNSGERLGKLPPAAYDMPEPQLPSSEEGVEGVSDMKARNVYMLRQRAYNQAKANNHSDRCSVNYRLEIARALLNDTFFFPHNLDFRGRAYPIPAHLNHIGDDLCRGLLTFGESKPLGERGLRWLKIHVANLYGYDKANFDDRVRWVDEHMDLIRETATDPLKGEVQAWWLEAGDPWQFLAASFELHAALESGDPYGFESSLPVHQDGTCNGLQHYAALGGDAQGAQQVNLAASDKPSDVYSHVGRMVEEVIAKDVERGEKYAILLQGKITRKVVKQTVMTTVYGVTYIGAREQIEKQIKDRKDIPEEDCWGAASYLAHVVLGCIGDLFKGAKAIQVWLNLCARIVSKSIPEERIPELMAEYLETPEERSKRKAAEEAKAKRRKPGGSARSKAAAKAELPMQRLKKEQMTSVIWTTPLGLPIVQPYRKTARKQVMTAVQTVYISDPNSLAEVNAVKQASAFPPNFIHSLDATHMMLTALECRKKGLTFASVHDSYWTHAADIDEMSVTIRDTFIALHSSDVLGELHREFLKRYKNFKVPLVNLSGSSLATKLINAGSRIYATPEQAASLSSLKDLVVVTDEGVSTIDESRAVKDENAMKKLLDDLKSGDGASLMTEDAESEGSEEEVEGETYQAKAAREKKAQQKEAVVKLMGKFVNLSDLFPPLPKKGEFDVDNIKQSQYFFS